MVAMRGMTYLSRRVRGLFWRGDDELLGMLPVACACARGCAIKKNTQRDERSKERLQLYTSKDRMLFLETIARKLTFWHKFTSASQQTKVGA